MAQKLISSVGVRMSAFEYGVPCCALWQCHSQLHLKGLGCNLLGKHPPSPC